jgi:hypothetical protein
VQYTFVGEGLSFVGRLFVGAGFVCGARSWVVCSWVLGCRLWARWCRIVCHVVTVSEIGWDGGRGTHLIDNLNKNDEQQHRCHLSFVSTSHSVTWHLETPAFIMLMWLALVHLVTWCCLAVVVMCVGDGCGWRPLVTVSLDRMGGVDVVVVNEVVVGGRKMFDVAMQTTVSGTCRATWPYRVLICTLY